MEPAEDMNDHDFSPKLTSLTIDFKVPASAAAKGVYLGIFGQLTKAYSTKAGGTIAAGSFVCFDGTDYAETPTSGNLPLYTLCKKGAVEGQLINLPLASVKGGAMVIGVGDAPDMPCDTSGAPSVPTVATNPDKIFGLFEYSLLDGKLDVDVSEVDQIGFPFTVTSTPAAPYPAQNGVGIPISRSDLFARYKAFDDFTGEGKIFQRGYDDGTPYRLVAPQTILNTIEAGGPVLGPVTYAEGGGLVIGRQYYYVVTATSATGETMPSENWTMAVPFNKSVDGRNEPQQTVKLSWKPFPNAAGYNIYRSTSVNGQELIDPVLAGTSTTAGYTDAGDHIRQHTPPVNSYAYDPLSDYFTDEIVTFFDHYKSNDFTVTLGNDVWTGGTVSYTPEWAPSETYTVLALKKGSDILRVYQPFFASNTDRNIAGISHYPGMPDWMVNKENTSPTETPSQMVFANDGVFASSSFDPDISSGLIKILADLENKIVTAFNRGMATNFDITPDNWANFPLFLSAVGAENKGANLTAGTYYYVMTSCDAEGSETTPSLEWQVKLAGTENSVILRWKPYQLPPASPGAAQYNIYRGTSPGSEDTLVAVVPNSSINPPTSYMDTGSSISRNAPPYTYYADGTVSNLYAKFLHQNYSYDTSKGISIHGLVYGFPFDDQGGLSTNIQYDNIPSLLTVSLSPWI